MAQGKLKGQAFWSVVLQFSRFGGNAVVFLAMARFLTIEQIGAFGMAYAPIRWTQALHKAGISNSVVATIRDKGRETAGTEDGPVFTALFWLSLGLSLLVMAGLGGLALLLAAVQDQEQPIAEMMLAMLAVPVALGLAAVPEGLLQKRLEIRSLALRTVTAQLLAAGLAVGLAFAGYGGWALVGFATLNAVLSSAVSIIMAGWRPLSGPKWHMIRQEMPRAMTIAGRALIAGGTRPLMQFCIGLFLGLEASGAFQIAQRIYQIIDALCLAPIRFLVLPLFARARERNGGALPGDAVLTGLKTAGAVTAPFYLGTIVIAAPALNLIIGPENAARSILPLQILCLMGFNITLVTILTQAATAAGHPGIPLRRAVMALLLTAALGLPALAVSAEAVTLCFVLAAYAALSGYLKSLSRVLGLPVRAMLGAVARPYLAGLLAALPLGAVTMTADLRPAPWAWAPLLLGAAGLYALCLGIFVPQVRNRFLARKG
ncbi:oligosaccharide flippase family protein [Leisingera thetidis]|uniref:oligosaccharide flippase family protein n=1 Tax=Leisingera thetidis TaxID=2930199 RepID=UPI0021F6BBBA|nr:oligosaccharide flippase family protein [Leisingera thetidis]